MNKMRRGLGLPIIILVLVIAGAVSYKAFSSREEAGTTDAEPVVATAKPSIVSFENEAGISIQDKQQILANVADPLVYYDSVILKKEVKRVVIKDVRAEAKGPNDFRYSLEYEYTDGTAKQGFLFGANNKIGYWQPQLCDDGGCDGYPQDFQYRYPANYQAFKVCQGSIEYGDKETAAEVCAP